MPILIFLDLFLIVIGISYFGYQIFLAVVGLRKPPVRFAYQPASSIAVVICARNEENVIENLIKSIKSQNYDQKKLDIWIIADNCTDQTASVAQRAGAYVLERHDLEHIGKGYIYQFFYSWLSKTGKITKYDAFVALDADNLLDQDFIQQLNNAFRAGNNVVTGYRNSKNFSHNWIASGSSLWFIRESRMYNCAKTILGITCHVGGTGFLVSRKLVQNTDYWRYHTLNEDQEFTMSILLRGEKVVYNQEAVFYDEQPTTLRQSWRQRIRWARGVIQVFRYFAFPSIKQAIRQKNLGLVDMSMFLFPWIFLVLIRTCTGFVFAGLGFVSWESQFQSFGLIVLGYIQGNLLIILVTLISVIVDREKISATNAQLVLYMLAFLFYCLCYFPISIIAIFSKPDWKPIHHQAQVADVILAKTIKAEKT
jgi:cellulose synthase/poly-beta-1,6-N-acetylglucosamine synthase-like glycosyltransferase